MAALYTPLILDHCANPRNYGSLDPYDISNEEENTLCGDRIRIDLRIERDSIVSIRFSGTGCAISQAATSILMSLVEYKDLRHVHALDPDDLLSELAIPLTSSRLQCALLGFHVLQAGIAGYTSRLASAS